MVASWLYLSLTSVKILLVSLVKVSCNRNKDSAIRSMVFCNGWYANKVSNLDADMLGFCPLHLTLFEREGKTTVVFNRPAMVAQNSPAKGLLMKIESEVIEAIRQGLL